MASAEAKLQVTELLASLSLATDLGTGQPLGHGLSTSALAVTLAREMGYGAEQVHHVQQVALLRFLGCTSDATDTARMVGGDEISFMSAFASSVMGDPGERLRAMMGAVAPGSSRPRRARLIAAALAEPGQLDPSLAVHCEVGAMLARRLGLAQSVVAALGSAYERWDGKGGPRGLAGEQIPPEVRIGVVARDADLFARMGEDVVEMLRRRRGKAYDPAVVDTLIRLRPSHREVEWDEVIEAGPGPATTVDDTDQALAAVADFVDLKSPWTRGHSPRVAELAGQAAATSLPQHELHELRLAALVHDLGRVGIENGIWDKSGPLAAAEWEKVRLHPYLTGRILARAAPLAGLAELASSHHERLDGSGYHRQSKGAQLTDAARILAAADMLTALTSDRPYRPALNIDDARVLMENDVGSGRLDPRAVHLVIEAAGGATSSTRSPNPGRLTDREIDVLRLLARGQTNRKIAEGLFISPKTVGRHVENIYAKIGVSTRVGATVYAMEQLLLN